MTLYFSSSTLCWRLWVVAAQPYNLYAAALRLATEMATRAAHAVACNRFCKLWDNFWQP